MRAELEVLLDALRALKKEGETDVFVEESTLAALRERVAACVGKNAPAPRVAGNVSQPSPAPRVAANVSSPSAKIFAEKKTFPSSAEKISSAEKQKSEFDPALSEARVAAVPAGATKRERLDALRAAAESDPVFLRHLHAGKHIVFGEGDPDAAVFFCGEAPGAEEETQGRPFVGPAGQLLDKMIAATGLSREQVYIGNVLKWRPETDSPTGNRPPTPEEAAYALPYLAAQIDAVRPRVVVALGLSAVNGLFGFDPDRGIGKMRGKKLDYRGIPVVATYHPSYLLRNNTAKSKRAAWEDFLAMMEIAELPISERQRNYFLKK